MRTLQAGFLIDAPKPDELPKTLRAAYSNYQKLHRVTKASPKADVVPTDAPVDLDENSWRKSPNEFPGDEGALAEVA